MGHINNTESRDGNNNMVPANDKDFETLKVAGFWSQLDDADTVDDDNDSHHRDGGRQRTVHQNGYEEEELPTDEQQWRRSQSSAGKGRDATSLELDLHKSSLELDLHKSESNDDTGETSSRRTKNTDTLLSSKNTNAGNGNLSIREKATCFARRNAAKVQEEEEDIPTADRATAHNMSDKSHEQSLDRSYQTSASATEGGRTLDITRTKDSHISTAMNNTGTTDTNDLDDRGMFNYIADALGAICGYSPYVSDVNIDSSKKVDNSDNTKKKERSFAIIEQNRQSHVDSQEKAIGGSSKNMQPMRSNNSECDEEDQPVTSDSGDAAIELEYPSRDDNEEDANKIATRSSMATHTATAGVAAVGTAGLVATTSTGKTSYSQAAARSAPTESLVSPATEKKKKRLTVKSVQNLLGLRKEKEVVSEELEPPSKSILIDGIPRSVAEQSEAEETNNNTTRKEQSPIDVVDEDKPETDTLFDENIEECTHLIDRETVPEDSTARGLNKYKYNEKYVSKPRKISDETELESQAPGWDSNRKNSYLRELAQRAKQEYQAKKSLESHGDSDLTTAVSASMGTVARAAISSRRSDKNDDLSSYTQENDVTSRAGLQASYNVDHNSFHLLEKQKFLQLLNSDMSPQDATRINIDEKGDLPMLEGTKDVVVSINHGDEEESVVTKEVSAKGELQPAEEERYEGRKSLFSHDPADMGERIHEVSISEKVTEDGAPQELCPDVAGAAIGVATPTLIIPSMVRAKTKSKNSRSQHDDEGNCNEQDMEQNYCTGADGLISFDDEYDIVIQCSQQRRRCR